MQSVSDHFFCYFYFEETNENEFLQGWASEEHQESEKHDQIIREKVEILNQEPRDATKV